MKFVELICNYFFTLPTSLPRLTAAEGLFLFAAKKKQKPQAENFSLKVSGRDTVVEPEKFIRPDFSRTEGRCYGSIGRPCMMK